MKKDGVFQSMDINSKVTVFSDPVRIVTLSAANYFMIPFLMAFGLSAADYGQAQSVANMVAFIMSFLAVAITNRLGRKLTTMLFLDLPYFIALVSLIFMKGYVNILIFCLCIIALTKVGMTAYILLMSEDCPTKSRSFVRGTTIAIPMAAGLLYPFIGMCFTEENVASVLRMFYIGFAVVFLINFLIRFKLYQETETGQKIMQSPQNANIGKSLLSYIKNLPLIIKSPANLLLMLVYFVVQAVKYMTLVVSTYVLGKAIVSTVEYSRLAVGVSVLTLLANFVIMPWLAKKKTNEIALFMVCCAGSAAMMFSFTLLPESSFLIMLFLNAAYGFFTFFLFTLSDTMIVNNVPDIQRSDVFGTIQVVTALLLIPVPAIYGKMLALNLELAVCVCCGIFICGLLLAAVLKFVLGKRNENVAAE